MLMENIYFKWMSFFGFFLHHFLLCEINTPCISEYNIKRAHEYRIAMHQSVCVCTVNMSLLCSRPLSPLWREIRPGLVSVLLEGEVRSPSKETIRYIPTHTHHPSPLSGFISDLFFTLSFYSVCHSYTGFTFTLKMIFGRKLPVELGKV